MDNADMMMMMMMMLFLDEQKPQTSRISQGYVDSRCPHFADRTLCLWPINMNTPSHVSPLKLHYHIYSRHLRLHPPVVWRESGEFINIRPYSIKRTLALHHILQRRQLSAGQSECSWVRLGQGCTGRSQLWLVAKWRINVLARDTVQEYWPKCINWRFNSSSASPSKSNLLI